jgi:hypothetical protein
MEDTMNPKYEFISNHREQLLIQAQQNNLIRNCRADQNGLRGKIFGKLGEALISSGSWLKKISRSPIEDNSVTIYSQN